jgi:hypothetical protein
MAKFSSIEILLLEFIWSVLLDTVIGVNDPKFKIILYMPPIADMMVGKLAILI